METDHADGFDTRKCKFGKYQHCETLQSKPGAEA
jgi:hypothetical protein